MTTIQHIRRVRKALVVAAALIACCHAWAQDYPTHAVRWIVPFPAGGGTDTVTRLVTTKMAETLRQPMLVDNRPGASTVIGNDLVAKAVPDGHTLLVNIPLLLQSSALLSKLPYDPVRDLVPVTTLVSAPLWLAVSTARVPGNSFPELIEQARRAPQPLEFASFGNGSTPHLYGFRLTESAGVNLVHVPYKGGAPAVLALMSGEIAMMFSDYVSLQPHLASGKVKIIAVTGPRRSRLTPQVPTMAELGHTGFEAVGWGGVFAPAKTPPHTVQQLAAAITAAVRDPAVSAKLSEIGYEPGGMPPAEFASQVKSDHALWTGLIRRAGVRLD